MPDNTGIEWTDATWNPVTGCTKVSPGCAHCYAEAITLRFKRGGPFLPGKTTIRLHPDRLDQPSKWRRPRRIFVNSMSDLFHEDVPFEFVDDIFEVMAANPRHTYQILTKRPERMLDYVEWTHWRVWPPQVWAGVSVENQYWADRRIPPLLETPAAVRFLSVEPLLKPVELARWLTWCQLCFARRDDHLFEGWDHSAVTPDWVIVGGESGPKARPMDPDWVRSLRDECGAAGVPFFFKQWGGARPGGDATLDGREWREFPSESSTPRPVPT